MYHQLFVFFEICLENLFWFNDTAPFVCCALIRQMRNFLYSLLAILPKPENNERETGQSQFLLFLPLNMNKQQKITGIDVHSVRATTKFINRGVPTTAIMYTTYTVKISFVKRVVTIWIYKMWNYPY